MILKRELFVVIALFKIFNCSPNSLYLPVTGYCPDAYKSFDQEILKFMNQRGFKAATLTITRGDQTLVKRGYGWQDEILTNPVKPDTVMRIASLSKIFTAAAIRKLIKQNKLKSDTKVFEFLNDFKKIKDNRIKDITIDNLLNHKGGWAPEESMYPLFSLNEIAKTYKKRSTQLTIPDIINYMFENQELQYKPGTKRNYSNFGYLLLGYIVEKVSGKKYIDYIKEEICKPNNIQIEQATTKKAASQNSNEIGWYGMNFPPPYGDYLLEVATCSFGLMMTSADIAKFLDSFWTTGEPKSPDDLAQGYTQYGSLPGSTAIARQRVGDVSIAILINSRDDNNWKTDNELLKNALDKAATKSGL